MEIENDKFVYYKSYGDTELDNSIRLILIELGFQKNNIVNQDPSKFAQIGDYIALIMQYADGTDFIIGKIKKDRKFTGSKPLVDLPTELVEYDELMRINLK